jgi:hypothetical protein
MALKVTEQDGNLMLWDGNRLIAEHKLSMQRGQLIQNSNHCRNHSAKIEELFEQTLNLLGATEQAVAFLTGIRKEKPRYIRDQFKLL